MSVTDVTARIGQIQAQLALLAPRTTGTSSTSAAGFATALRATTDAAGTAPAAGGVSGEDVVAEARKHLGVPYVWGGTHPERGLDCSGLVQVVYKTLGIDLPRVSYQQAASGRPVASMAEAQPGDLIAWDNSSRNSGVDHIAIYVGNGQMIEAPRPGGHVQLVPVPSTPDVIRRILPEQTAVGRVAATGDAVPAGTPFARLFEAAGAKYGVSPELLAAIAKQESGFDPLAVSPAGAQGLMQLMPATADGLGVANSFDPSQAVDGAARLMRSLLDRFDSTPLALAAYNAGPGAVLRYDGIPPYAETQNYVRSIMSMLEAS